DVSRIVKWENVGVLQASQQPDFAKETQLARVGCRVSEENLQRDFPLVLEVLGEVVSCERALADLMLDVEVAAQRGAERSDRIGWWSELGRIRHPGSAGRLWRNLQQQLFENRN